MKTANIGVTLPQGLYEPVAPEGDAFKQRITVLGNRIMWSVDKEGGTTHRVYRYRFKEGILYLDGINYAERCPFKARDGSIWIADVEFKMKGFVIL